jgi:hypothetical protein
LGLAALRLSRSATLLLVAAGRGILALAAAAVQAGIKKVLLQALLAKLTP